MTKQYAVDSRSDLATLPPKVRDEVHEVGEVESRA